MSPDAYIVTPYHTVIRSCIGSAGSGSAFACCSYRASEGGHLILYIYIRHAPNKKSPVLPSARRLRIRPPPKVRADESPKEFWWSDDLRSACAWEGPHNRGCFPQRPVWGGLSRGHESLGVYFASRKFRRLLAFHPPAFPAPAVLARPTRERRFCWRAH